MKAQLRFKQWVGVACAIVFWTPGAALAQLGGSLTVENSSVLTDVIGRILPGTWGFPDQAVRVEIRETNPSGGIAPPDPETGEGNEGVNPLVRASYMGSGISIVQNPGRFSETFAERLDGAKRYYARVYDRPSAGASLYYRDSSWFQDNGVAESVDPVFGGAWRLIATGQPDVDSDGDGIPDALESDIGLNPGNPDTDGDGYGDLFELVYIDYMNPTEPDPPFVVALIPPVYTPAAIEGDPMVQEGPHTVSWLTVPVPGLYYRLEWIDELPFDEEFTQTIWDGVLAQPGEPVDVDVEAYIRDDGGIRGFFRVWAETP
jgi:hypothetical protein